MLPITVRHDCLAPLGLMNVNNLMVNPASQSSLYSQSQRAIRPQELMGPCGSLLSDSQLRFLRSFCCDQTKVAMQLLISSLKLCIFGESFLDCRNAQRNGSTISQMLFSYCKLLGKKGLNEPFCLMCWKWRSLSNTSNRLLSLGLFLKDCSSWSLSTVQQRGKRCHSQYAVPLLMLKNSHH